MRSLLVPVYVGGIANLMLFFAKRISKARSTMLVFRFSMVTNAKSFERHVVSRKSIHHVPSLDHSSST